MSHFEKRIISQLLRDAIIRLCRTNVLYPGSVDIDGIIVISGQHDGQQLVVKIRELITEEARQQETTEDKTLDNDVCRLRDNNSENIFSADLKHLSKKRRLDNYYNELGRSSWEDSRYDYGRSKYVQSGFNALAENLSEPSRISKSILRNNAADLTVEQSHAGIALTDGNNLALDYSLSLPHSLTMSLPPHLPVTNSYGITTDNICSSFDEHRDTRVDSSHQDRVNKRKAIVRRRPASAEGKSETARSRVFPFGMAALLSPNALKCSSCPDECKFESPIALSEHNESAHSVFTCLICVKTFTSRSNLERHSRLHTGARPFACAICAKTFSRKDHLSNHAMKHEYRCGTCSMRCADRSTLAAHFLIYHHREELTELCMWCNKGFSSVYEYEEHVKIHPQFYGNATAGSTTIESSPSSSSIYRRRRKYKCDRCSYHTVDRMSYTEHMSLHVLTNETEGRNNHSNADFTAYTHSTLAHDSPDQREAGFNVLTQLYGASNISSSWPYNGDRLHGWHERVHHSRHWGSGGRSRWNGALLVNRAGNRNVSRLLQEIYTCQRCKQTFESYDILREHEQIHDEEEAAAARINSELNETADRGKKSEPNGFMSDEGGTLHIKIESCDDDDNLLHLDAAENSVVPGFECFGEQGLNAGHSPVVYRDCVEEKRDKRKQRQPKTIVSHDESLLTVTEKDMELGSPEIQRTMSTSSQNEETNGVEDGSTGLSSLDKNITDMCSDTGIKFEPCFQIMSRSNCILPQRSSKTRQRDIMHSNVSSDEPEDDPSTLIEADSRPQSPDEIIADILSVVRPQHPSPSGNDPDNVNKTSKSQGVSVVSNFQDSFGHIEINTDSTNEINTISEHNGAVLENYNTRFHEDSLLGPPYTCSVCGISSDTFMDMESHCMTAHGRTPCAFCMKTFAQKANRDRHACMHTGVRPYSCSECGETFARGDKLKQHRVRDHDSTTYNVGESRDCDVNDGLNQTWPDDISQHIAYLMNDSLNQSNSVV